jgi:hypothetical protein
MRASLIFVGMLVTFFRTVKKVHRTILWKLMGCVVGRYLKKVYADRIN